MSDCSDLLFKIMITSHQNGARFGSVEPPNCDLTHIWIFKMGVISETEVKAPSHDVHRHERINRLVYMSEGK